MRSFNNISSDLNEQVPNEWEVTKLNLIANLRRGPFGGALKVDNFVSEGYAVYEQQHAIHKKLSNIRYFIDEKKYKEMQAFLVEKNDILLSCSGTIGESVIIPTNYKEGIINQALLRIRLLRPDINLEYFKYYMDSYLFQTLITDNSHGSAMKNIASMNVINKIPVPVPSEDEQEKIVLILNSKLKVLDRTIDMKYKILELLEKQRQSIITEAVTKGLNPNVKMKDSGVEWIGEVSENINFIKLKYLVAIKITDGPHETPTLKDEGIPFISAEAIKNGKVDFNYKRGFISAEDHEKYSKKCSPRKGDIFMVKSGATTGKFGIVETEEEFSIWSPLALIRADLSKVNILFLYYCFYSTIFQMQVQTGWNYGTQQNIGMGVIENLFIPCPSLEEQNEVVNYIVIKDREMVDLISQINVQIEKLKEYRQALIYEAVTGKIDVCDMELELVR
ncbi:restriction endonuclease subunit S [Cytobacillus oceanisediminis]|uniref:restriction endonuclease subunit S n=1 Tax=Cytobacillus oceanisediminis TaxID=665099 RepID=UPI0023D98A51|nr:restriction endonuclease subunit S [Cytobacillus oceanisediminis]MDF2036324.1 restriction endonuclease subunit S [Cytobacillus oceanisediminis]